MRKIQLPMAALCLTAWAAGAAPRAPAPADFAYGLRLELEPGGAIYGLEVPDPVYDGVTRGDLGDLRVFNGLGEVLAQTLQQPEAPAQTLPAPVAVPFFPLYLEGHGAAAAPRLRVRSGPGGTLIELTDSVPASVSHPGPLAAYLVDLSQWRDRPLRGLRLAWVGAPTAGFVVRVTLEVSDDLDHWRPAGSGALADLGLGTQRLRRDTLRPSARGAYLRIAWPSPLATTTLHQVQALPRGTNVPEPRRRQREVPGRAMDGAPVVFLFDAGGRLPVDRIQVHLPQSNTLVPVDIRSRRDAGGDWLPRYRGTLYDLTLEGIRLRNEPIPLPPLAHRQWRLAVGGEGGGLGTGVPTLELAWRPSRLLFLARGPGPYLLAYGSRRVGPVAGVQAVELARLAAEPRRVRAAHVAGPIPLSGAAALAAPRPPIPWSRLLLWGVLVLCVLALAWMALRLYRQLGEHAAVDTQRTPQDPRPGP
jgi:Protein of unknown function (DUF3999)